MLFASRGRQLQLYPYAWAQPPAPLLNAMSPTPANRSLGPCRGLVVLSLQGPGRWMGED